MNGVEPGKLAAGGALKQNVIPYVAPAIQNPPTVHTILEGCRFSARVEGAREMEGQQIWQKPGCGVSLKKMQHINFPP